MTTTSVSTPLPQAKRGVRYPGVPALLLVLSLIGGLSYIHGRPAVPGFTGFSVLDLLQWLMCFWPWALITPVVFRLEKRFPLQRENWLRHAALLALVSPLWCYLAYKMTELMWVLSMPMFLQTPLQWRQVWAIPVSDFFFQQMLFWVSVAGGVLFRNWIRFQEQERERAQLVLEKSRLENSLRHAELNVLRMRLNPHFLFNTLQNISVLAQENPKVAGQMLTRLGDLLRSALHTEREPEVPLSVEIALTESYLAVEQMRFGDRLKVLLELAPGTTEAMVPTLLLQPLVENAIRHGLRNIAENGVIAIRSEISAQRLVLTVTDNGSGVCCSSLEELDLGIGLASTRDRLAGMYKQDGLLAIAGRSQGGTEVRLTLPLRMAPHETPTYEQAAAAHCG
jgi:two-component system LytT family sensor kinase